MKKLFLLLALMGIVAVGCSKDDTDKGNDNKTEQPNENEGGNEDNIPGNIFFGLDKESVTISPDGGSVDVIVYSNYKWEISGTSDWCTPSVKGGDANEDGQKVTFSADVAYDDREATFWFRCADKQIKFIVSQKLKEAIIPDANNSFNIPAEGGVAVISYQTTVDCDVIIPEEAQDWITISPATRGLISENINLDIAENTTYSSRTAVVKVVAKDNAELAIEYTINQEQNDTILADENNTFTVPSAGGEVVINYRTNIDCEVIIPEEAQDWITIAPATRGLFSESITLNIAENTTYSARTAIVKVVAKDNAKLAIEYTINQEQKNALLVDNNNTFTVPSAGGEVAINYQTNIDCDVIIPEEAQEWITIAPATRGLFSESITLDIAENTTYSARTAVVKVVAKDNAELAVEYTINQEQNDAVLADGNTEFTISGREQQITIEHKANVDCDVIIPDEAQDWVTIAPATRGLSTYSTTLNIAENNSGKERSCVIKVTSQGDNEIFAEYTIIQNPRCFLYYTSNDGKIVTPYDSSSFGATIISNTYKDGVGVIEFDAPITTIGYMAFWACYSLTSVTIGDSVTSIGQYAFRYCDSLTSVTIPDSVTTIGDNAFAWCDSLTSVTIPDSVTTIGDNAFEDCDSLTSVTIPDSVTTIGTEAFRYCSRLSCITIPDSVTTIGDAAFANCSSLQEFKSKFASEDCRCLIIDGTLNSFAPGGLVEYTIPDSVTTIGWAAFDSCTSLTSVTIPDSVTTIGDFAFYYCSSLTSVTIPNSVTSIGERAFKNCDSLASINIPESVASIGNEVFHGCTGELIINNKIVETDYDSSNYPFKNGWLYGSKFTSLIIGNGVTSIGDYAFRTCDSLTSVTIGDSVTTIGDYAFYWCSSLTSVYCKPTTPPSLDGAYVFYANGSGRKIYVPMESVEVYKSASGWRSSYKSSIVGYDF